MEKKSNLIIFESEILDPEELKADIESINMLLADLKDELYIAEHKDEKSRKMEKLLEKKNNRERKRIELFKKSMTPTFVSFLQTIPNEDFLRMLKEK